MNINDYYKTVALEKLAEDAEAKKEVPPAKKPNKWGRRALAAGVVGGLGVGAYALHSDSKRRAKLKGAADAAAAAAKSGGSRVGQAFKNVFRRKKA